MVERMELREWRLGKVPREIHEDATADADGSVRLENSRAAHQRAEARSSRRFAKYDDAVDASALPCSQGFQRFTVYTYTLYYR